MRVPPKADWLTPSPRKERAGRGLGSTAVELTKQRCFVLVLVLVIDSGPFFEHEDEDEDENDGRHSLNSTAGERGTTMLGHRRVVSKTALLSPALSSL